MLDTTEMSQTDSLKGFKVQCQRLIHKQITPLKSVRDVQGKVEPQGGGVSSSQRVKKGFIDNKGSNAHHPLSARHVY